MPLSAFDPQNDLQMSPQDYLAMLQQQNAQAAPAQPIAQPAPQPMPQSAPAAPPSFLQRVGTGLNQFAGNQDLALALLANSGYGPKRSLGQTLGQSALQAQQMGQQRQDDAFKRQYQMAQMAAMGQKESKPIAIIGPDGKPILVNERDAIGHSPYAGGADAKPSAFIQAYDRYLGGGGKLGVLEFAREFAKNNAQYPYTVTMVNGVPTLVPRISPDDTGAPPPPDAGQPPLTPPPAAAPPPGIGQPPSAGPQIPPSAQMPPFSPRPPLTPPIKPLSTLQTEADAKRKLAAAGAGGAVTGEKVAGAQFDLSRVEANIDQANSDIDKLKNHPGLPYITGIYSKAPIVPNTDQAGADALAKQVGGQTFLQAYNSLRGAGAITEVEGQQAKDSIARLSRAQKTDDYKAALDELKGILNKGRARLRAQAGASNDPLGIR